MIYISRVGLDSLSGGPTNVDSARPKKSDAFQHGYIYAFSKIQSKHTRPTSVSDPRR